MSALVSASSGSRGAEMAMCLVMVLSCRLTVKEMNSIQGDKGT